MYYTPWPGWLYLNKIWVRIRRQWVDLSIQGSPGHSSHKTSHHAEPQHHVQRELSVSAQTLSEHPHDRQDPAAGSQHHHYRNHRLLLCLLPGVVPTQSIWWGADGLGLCCVSLHQHSHHGNTALPTRSLSSMEIICYSGDGSHDVFLPPVRSLPPDKLCWTHLQRSFCISANHCRHGSPHSGWPTSVFIVLVPPRGSFSFRHISDVSTRQIFCGSLRGQGVQRSSGPPDWCLLCCFRHLSIPANS